VTRRVHTTFDAARLAACLRLACHVRNLSQAAASRQSGVNPSTFNAAINESRRGISVDSLFMLCAWLGRSPSDFATGKRREGEG